MLRLPKPGEETPPLVVEEAKRRRRRNSSRSRDKRAEEIFDETFAGKTGPDPIFGRILAATVVTAVVAIAIGLLWPEPREESPDTAFEFPEPLPGELGPEPEPESVDEPQVLSVTMIRDELEPVVRSFLDAPDLESAAAWAAHSERTLERMRDFHDGDYRPPGMKSVLWNSAMTRGEAWASFRVETDDFRRQTVFLVEDDGWKVDWDSWVGWSPASWDELQEERPVETVRLRALVRPVDYYNFRFSSESEWAAVTLVAPDGESSIYGYVPRASELHSRLTFLDGTKERRLIVDIRYPKNAPVGNQVLIEGVVGEGWLDTEETP